SIWKVLMLAHLYFPVLALLWSAGLAQLQVQAQSGYNYGRPEVANVGGATAGGRLTPAPYPTAAALPLTPAPATTAYGAGLFPSPAVGFTPSGQATTAFGAPAVVAPSSLNQQRRPVASGIPAASSRSGPYGPQTASFGNVPGAGSSASRASNANDGAYTQDDDGDYSAIPGVPGVDYPIYAQVPRTNFDCSQQPLPGYYADIEAQCQVFHICALNRTYSFLCPNGTVFSQETLVCVWWNQYDCVSAPSLYANNAYIYDYSGGSGSNANANANTYRAAAAPATTAFGAPVATTGTLRATGVPPQVAGYGAGRPGSYPSATPTPAAYGAGAVLRPGLVPGAVVTPQPVSNRLAPTAAAAGLLAATAAGALPENQVVGGGYGGQQGAGGNREYLPPAGAAQQRQRGGTSA
ncbi:hypothetical protein KR018_007865, partial [Drosophila ironensis]